MKKLCKIITYGLAKQLDKDQHWCNIFQYAIQVTLEKWISLTVMGLLATWFGYGKEYLLFLLIFIPLRSFGGGLHMKTYTVFPGAV